ncbi:N-acetylglucosamine kinase, partial [Pengzhenrongella sp.]|uniref:N-acetylglucosamine kinase n=1 Tax=Pengzhenrongella sp. TaxID=2888820 RepID=UPI002F92D8EA
MSDLILAVDGGQTGTVAVLAGLDGNIRGVGRGGPIRHHEEPDAERFVRDGLGAAVAGAMHAVADGDVVAVSCLAMTGSVVIANRVIRELVVARAYLALASDTLAALASGTAGGGGIGLIAGTGTVALAHGRGADDVLVGGWGWLLGDEGGGFWIAMEALKAAARDVDGTGEHTRLTLAVPPRLGQPDMRGVYNLVTGRRLDRTAIAALTTTVVAVAEAGDTVAAGILDRAADRLADLVVATVAAASFLESDERLIVPSGGVLRPGGWVLTRLTAQLAVRTPDFRVVVPQVPPVIGAYWLP